MIDLEKLSNLEKVAIPAPWYVWKYSGRDEVPHSTNGGIFTISKEMCVKKWQERDPLVKNSFPLDEDIVIDCTEYFNMPHQYQTFEFIAEMRNQLPYLLTQIKALKKIALEERAAVLTADICDGCDSYGGLCMSGRAALRGEPTRVDDFEGHEERIVMARSQLSKEYPEIDWE